MACLLTSNKRSLKELENLQIKMVLPSTTNMIVAIQITSPLVEKIKSAQFPDLELVKIKEMVKERIKGFELVNGVLRFRGILSALNVEKIRKDVLRKAHRSVYASYPGGTKIYHDLKENYWWSGMKRDVAKVVSQCLTCQRVKAEHQKPVGLLQHLLIPEWKWEHISMYFVMVYQDSQTK